MVDAVGGLDTALYFRPVDAAAPVGPDADAQKRTPGVVDADGRPVSREPRSSEQALSQEKRALLARLRGERAALEEELLHAPFAKVADEPTSTGAEDLNPNAPLQRREQNTSSPAQSAEGSSGPGELSTEEQEQVDQLEERDREVRAHEQAHAMVGGQYAGSPSYEYQTGPDGRRYAVGGSVPIDVSPVPGDPQATIDKMQQVAAAALAPAEPSAADRSIAQTAQAEMQKAMADARAETNMELRGEPVRDDGAIITLAARSASQGYASGRAAMAGQQAPTVRLAA